MASVVNVHFPETGTRTILFQPYTLENLAGMMSAVLGISVGQVTRSYRAHYKENGNEVQISSSIELSGYILKSMPTSDIYVVKIQTETPDKRQTETRQVSQQSGDPINIHFVDTEDETQLGPPHTVENLADLVEVVLDIPANEYMSLCRTHINDSSGKKISVFRAQDFQPLIDNRSGEMNIFIALKKPREPTGSTRQPFEETKTEQRPTGLPSQAVWRQAEGAAHPMVIGNSQELGLGGNYTALCWLKSINAERNAIFMGDYCTTGIPCNQGT